MVCVCRLHLSVVYLSWVGQVSLLNTWSVSVVFISPSYISHGWGRFVFLTRGLCLSSSSLRLISHMDGTVITSYRVVSVLFISLSYLSLGWDFLYHVVSVVFQSIPFTRIVRPDTYRNPSVQLCSMVQQLTWPSR